MCVVAELPILQGRLARYDSINYGGCGVIAAHIAKRLSQFVPTRIAIYNTSDHYDVDRIRPNIKNTHSSTEWDRHGLDWDHILVEFEHNGEKYLVDSRSLVKSEPVVNLPNGRYYLSGYITIDEVCGWARTPRFWNWRFDRKQIPAIRKTIHRFFNKLEAN